MKNKKRVLIVGNHTCANRGDSAILRGLLDALTKRLGQGLEIQVMSRYPQASSYLLRREVLADPLIKHYFTSRIPYLAKVKAALSTRFMPSVVAAKLDKRWWSQFITLPKQYQQFVQTVQDYDLVIQVGGSFFVDLYADKQFEHPLLTLLANKPILFIGHSLGPYERDSFKRIARTVLPKVSQIIAREPVSVELTNALFDQPLSNLSLNNDTAWLMSPDTEGSIIRRYIDSDKPTIAITVRDLAPFDQRLGVTQHEYEQRYIALIDHLNFIGYQVIAASMCTGLDGYHKDDRMVALRIQKQLRNPQAMTVVMDELNDLQLGELFSACALTIGTRLHSAIISMRFGTPAIAVFYEHKSQGIMQTLDYPERSIAISQLDQIETYNLIDDILHNQAEVRDELAEKVQTIAHKLEEEITTSVQKILV